MKNLLTALASAAAFLVALAPPASGHDRQRVITGQAFGAARFTVSPGQDERFKFAAVDRNGRRDQGFIRYRNATAGFDYKAKLVCVAVAGTTARFGYVIPNESDVPAAIRGLGVVFQVVDNGRPGAGRDLVGYVSGPAALAAACDATAVSSTSAIREGEIVVRPERAVEGKHGKKNKDDDTDDTDDTNDTDDSDD